MIHLGICVKTTYAFLNLSLIDNDFPIQEHIIIYLQIHRITLPFNRLSAIIGRVCRSTYML